MDGNSVFEKAGITMLVFVLTLGCAHPVDITLTGAEIAPTMATGTAWDGPNSLSPGARGVLDSALAGLDSSGQLSSAVKSAADTLARPDPAASLVFLPEEGTAPVHADAAERPDTLTPAWTGPTLKGVLWSPAAKLEITLIDHDVATDDPIGKVVLRAGDLARAEANDGPLTFPVADQTSGQVLSVTVSVVAASK